MTFADLQDAIHALLKFKHEAKDLKLLNVGTDHPREYHWRFRTAEGVVIMLSMESES